jgi:pimeloyl-ACP methyl ester carboxylesterase
MRFAAGRQGVRIAYEVLGLGAPLVLLHGFGESSGFWHELGYVEDCLSSGRKVVLIDLRGHGASAKPHDETAYAAGRWSEDVLDVLDHAGIEQADILGYGLGGRVGLRLSCMAPGRVHAVAAGGAHPFAEPKDQCRRLLAKGLEHWIKVTEAKSGGFSAQRRQRLTANDPAALLAAVQRDQPDMADAVARAGVPVLLFLGKDDPRYPLGLSFVEQAAAKVIGVGGCDHHRAPMARQELLPRLLDFFASPDEWGPAECVPVGLWSGSWA